MHTLRRVRSTAMVVTLAGGLALGACGSDSGSGGSETTAAPAGPTAAPSADAGSSVASEPGNTGLAAAEQLVDQFTGDQPPIELEQLPAKPEPGKRVAVLTCGFPACQSTTAGVQAAADALSWPVTVFTSEITPEAYVETWNQLLQDPPDMIVFTGLLPNAIVEDQLAKVEELGIPMVAIAASDPPGGVVQAVYIGAPQVGKSGELMGAAVAADSGGDAKAVFVWDPNTEPIMGPVKSKVEEVITAAGGTVDVLEISLQDTGTKVPGQVVSYLQNNPDTEYVVFAISNFDAGVPEALAEAGITNVKIIGRSPEAGNLQNVLDGTSWAMVAEESIASGYRAIDALARIDAGLPIDVEPEGWHRILTAENITDVEADLQTPGVPESFLEAWRATEG